MPVDMESRIFIIIIIISVVLFIISLIKKKFDLIVNFGLRVLVGLLTIYILNTLLAGFHVGLAVGMNIFTTFITGILGLPGVIMLYGLAFYFYIF